MHRSSFRFSPDSSSRLGSFVAALALLLAGFASPPAAAQVDDIDELMRGGINDASLLIDAYLAPGITGFETGLNTGWAGSARPHSQLGFHLRIGATLSRVPSGDRTFTVEPMDLETLTIENSSLGASPTVAGDDDVSTYRFQLPSGRIVTMPEGTGFSLVPTPVIEAGVGVVQDTELMLRLVPSIDIEDYGDLSLFGIGVKHGLNQWLPGGALLPVDLSAMLHYTRFNLDAVLDDADTQNLEWDTNAWAFNVLVGKNLPVLSVYGGVGLETSSSNIALTGPYTVEDEEGNTTVVEDPLDLDFGQNTSLRMLAGARLRLAVFALLVEGTLANYPSVTVGLGVSVR